MLLASRVGLDARAPRRNRAVAEFQDRERGCPSTVNVTMPALPGTDNRQEGASTARFARDAVLAFLPIHNAGRPLRSKS
jgi:hypothetical protein